MSGVECTYSSINIPSTAPISMRGFEALIEELAYSMPVKKRFYSIKYHAIKLPRYYLYFADRSCFSFRLSDMYSEDIKTYNFIFSIILLYLELNSAILVDDEMALRSLNSWFTTNGIAMGDLKPYMIDAMRSYGAEKTIKILSKYSFFSFESIVKILQEDELYDILAEVLEAGNKFGLIGNSNEEELL